MRVALAGATGAIGKRLLPLLLDAGYDVVGLTRSPEKASALRASGAETAVVDVFDSDALTRVLLAARPKVVIHQLTDLPPGLDPTGMAEAVARNARIRTEGTRNLAAAAVEAGAERLVSQSIAWAYAPGREPYLEEDPLDTHAQGARAITVGGVAALERLTLTSLPLQGTVLRYGRLYGPGTGTEVPGNPPPLHVDAAAWAALLAIRSSRSGIYNIAETNNYVATTKARRELGWDAGFRLSVDATALSKTSSSIRQA